MRMAFAMFSDQSDISKKNGAGDFIFRNMRAAGADIFPVGHNPENHLLYFKSKIAAARLLGRQFVRQRDPLYLQTVARRIEAELADAGNYDCIFAFGALQLAYLNVKKPIYFWSDTPFRGLIDLNYPYYRKMYDGNRLDAEKADKLALEKCRLAFYSSEWASNLAAETYGIDRKKIITVPLGANINREPQREEVEKYLERRLQNKNEISIILAGQDWEFKGVPIACEVTKRLNAEGIKARLTVIGNGTKVPAEYADCVQNSGYFDKNTEEGSRRFEALFSDAFCYFMPTRGEAFGHVFCEAGAYGLPALGSAVGGVTEIIRNGVNGRAFDFNAPIEEYVEFIRKLYEDAEYYAAMNRRSFEEYHSRLRWSDNCRTVYNYIRDDLNR